MPSHLQRHHARRQLSEQVLHLLSFRHHHSSTDHFTLLVQRAIATGPVSQIQADRQLQRCFPFPLQCLYLRHQFLIRQIPFLGPFSLLPTVLFENAILFHGRFSFLAPLSALTIGSVSKLRIPLGDRPSHFISVWSHL